MSAFVCSAILGGAAFVSLSSLDRSLVLQVPLLLRPVTTSLVLLGTGLLDPFLRLVPALRRARVQTSGDGLTASPKLFLRDSFGDLGRVSGSCYEREVNK